MHKLKNRNIFVPDQYRIPGSGDPIERNRKIVKVNIDRSVFQKSKKDKEFLKLLKLQAKLEELKT